ncbi:MAG: hypothetical protein QF411_09340, partial [Planctomycetota bacterium]|nr:hypothetical protein [Planctomycetota bacterium]
FEMEYTSNPAASGPTEVYVPATRLYGDSFQLTFSDTDGSWSHEYDAARQVLSVFHDPNTERHILRISP